MIDHLNNRERPLVIRQLNQQSYQATWESMRTFCNDRNIETADEVWFVEHPPVFTQGVSGKAEHILTLRFQLFKQIAAAKSPIMGRDN